MRGVRMRIFNAPKVRKFDGLILPPFAQHTHTPVADKALYFCGMPKKTLVFLGSKPIGYRCFEHILQQQDAMNVEVCGLLCNEKPSMGAELSLRELAEQNKVPVYEHPDHMPEADILYSVQYHLILKSEHIARARQIAVNLHMAPLPEYRGCNQFSLAIIDGAREFGTSLHRIDERIDHGDLLWEKRFPIPDQCWVQDLYELTYQASLDLFRETLPDILNEHYRPVPQEQLVAARGTSLHFRNEMNSLKQIDLSWDAEKIARHIRGTSMPGFEPPFTIIDGKKIYFSTEWAGAKK